MIARITRRTSKLIVAYFQSWHHLRQLGDRCVGLALSVLTAGSAAVHHLNLTFAALVTQNTAISIAPLRMTRE